MILDKKAKTPEYVSMFNNKQDQYPHFSHLKQKDLVLIRFATIILKKIYLKRLEKKALFTALKVKVFLFRV